MNNANECLRIQISSTLSLAFRVAFDLHLAFWLALLVLSLRFMRYLPLLSNMPPHRTIVRLESLETLYHGQS